MTPGPMNEPCLRESTKPAISTAGGRDLLEPARETVFPLRFYDLGDRPLIELWDLDNARRPESLVYSVRRLEERVQTEPCLPPAAFIFHCTRCGSTLLARILAANETNRVYNEPAAFHHFRDAMWNKRWTAETRRVLKVLVEAFGLGLRPGEARFMIKFDSRAILFLDLLHECFPNVPFIYLLRDPSEVVTSLYRNPPGYLQSENRAEMAAAFGATAQETNDYSLLEWCSWYVDRNLRRAWQARDRFEEIIDYSTYADRYLETANRISGGNFLQPDSPVLRTYSKNPETPFSPMNAPIANPEAQSTARRIAGEAYRLWNELLLTKSAGA